MIKNITNVEDHLSDYEGSADYEAQNLSIQNKRAGGISPNSAREGHDNENYFIEKSKHNSSRGGVSVGHISVNSVTDEHYYRANSDSDSQSNAFVKKQMIRYLSRVHDRNKPLFVFN